MLCDRLHTRRTPNGEFRLRRELYVLLCSEGSVWPGKARRTVPRPFDKRIPVYEGENILLEVIEGSSRDVLRPKYARKCFGWYTAVLELAEHKLVVSGQEGCQVSSAWFEKSVIRS